MGPRIIKTPTLKSVPKALDALSDILENNGAKIVARVDHGAGARTVDMDIGASELLIFGNPALGTPAMVHDRLAGLFLPLKVLGYTDIDGANWLAYEDPAHSFAGLSVETDAEYIKKVQSVLEKFVGEAAAE